MKRVEFKCTVFNTNTNVPVSEAVYSQPYYCSCVRRCSRTKS